jgi:hypothetical protein
VLDCRRSRLATTSVYLHVRNEEVAAAMQAAADNGSASVTDADRIGRLERQLAELRAEIA